MRLGVSAKVVLFSAANPARVALCREYGADIVYAEDLAEAFELVRRVEAEEGRYFVHPFNGYRTVLGSATLDYDVRTMYSDQTDPLTMTTTFRESRVTFLPNVTASSIDPDNIQANPQNEVLANYNFNSQLTAINFAKDRDIVGAFNARTPLTTSAAASAR